MESKRKAEQPTSAKPEKESSESTEKNQAPAKDLFKSYMQCFENTSKKNMEMSKKWQELVKTRKFWNNQPVIQASEMQNEHKQGPLKSNGAHSLTKEQTKLPGGYTWREFDLNDEGDLQDLYTLLYENYVEDDGGTFRFNYSKKFLQWALMPPGYDKDLFFGMVRHGKKKDYLVGFISGIVLDLVIEGIEVKVTEVNFLCVNKKYRNMSMAAVLIREVVRRSNLKGIFQGLFTSGNLLPTPFAQTRYWHRALNPKKLLDVSLL